MASWMSADSRLSSLIPVLYTLGAIWILQKAIRFLYAFLRRRSHSTALYGPPRTSLLWGANRMILTSTDRISIFEEWLSKYGPAFSIPGPLGADVVVLCDPKAIAHFYGRETYGYHQTAFARMAIEHLVREILHTHMSMSCATKNSLSVS